MSSELPMTYVAFRDQYTRVLPEREIMEAMEVIKSYDRWTQMTLRVNSSIQEVLPQIRFSRTDRNLVSERVSKTFLHEHPICFQNIVRCIFKNGYPL